MKRLKEVRQTGYRGLQDITGLADALLVTLATGALGAAFVATLLASTRSRSFTEGLSIVVFSWAISSDLMLELLDLDDRISKSTYLRLAVPYRHCVLGALALVGVCLYGPAAIGFSIG